MHISVITVTWNSKEQISQQIESVQQGAGGLQVEQIVVDNGSTDGTVEHIKNRHPEVRVIANEKNMGFGAANQQGVAVSSGRYYLFLNPDMRVEKDSLAVLYSWMEKHKNVGIVSPKLVDEQGNINWDATPRRFPKLWEQLAIIIKLPHIFPKLLNAYHMKNFDPDQEQDVDTVRGSFMLMRKEVVDVLGWAWDPRYFIWYEDVDICREVWRLGYKVMYTPVITCVDYVGQSFKKRTTLWKQKQFTASMLTYYKKWEPWYVWMWIALFRPIGISLVKIKDSWSLKK